MILDSDIIIYSALPENQRLRDFVRANSILFSEISMVEVLGFHRLAEFDRKYFEIFFASLTRIEVSREIISEAISLRQQRKIGLGDSLIAASA
ncbi:MAG: PIN domain-containing protein, partial [Pyrinomonadaceae bacterium]